MKRAFNKIALYEEEEDDYDDEDLKVNFGQVQQFQQANQVQQVFQLPQMPQMNQPQINCISQPQNTQMLQPPQIPQMCNMPQPVQMNQSNKKPQHIAPKSRSSQPAKDQNRGGHKGGNRGGRQPKGPVRRTEESNIANLWQGRDVQLIRNDPEMMPQQFGMMPPNVGLMPPNVGMMPPQQFGMMPPHPGRIPPPPIMQQNRRKLRKAAANVVCVQIETILQDTALATGDPVFCDSCQSLLNKNSPLKDQEGQQVWVCEFCEFQNIVDLDEEEMPSDEIIKYLLDGAVQAAQQNQGSDDQRVLIFCIDISGSMCVTTPVEGNIQLLTNQNTMEQQLLKQFRGDGEQYLPQENRNLTYISRLECVQAAIDHQINELSKATPNKKVGIVTFNNDVTILGDGQSNLVISGDKLSNWDQIEEIIASQQGGLLTQSIQNSKEVLKQRLMELQETGATALGPALLACLLLAKHSSGEVILCTDGIANVGLGSYEEDDEAEQAELFYDRVTQIAQDCGVTVSVISISGDNCKLDQLSTIVEQTGGELNKVDPTQLHQNFANILQTKVVATQVRIEVNLHKSLQINNEEQFTNPEKTRLVKNLGTVTDDTEFAFEFSFKEKTDKKQLPLQVLIYHTKLDGMKCVLVDSKMVETSDNKEELIQQADMDVIATNYRVQTNNMIRNGNWKEAQRNALRVQNQMQTPVFQQNYQMMQVQNELNDIGQALQQEIEQHGLRGPSKRVKSDALSVKAHGLVRKSKHGQ